MVNDLADTARKVSVPSSGDYQFLRVLEIVKEIKNLFPSPHPGIINFFPYKGRRWVSQVCFRPLIRGLSISSRKPPISRARRSRFRPLIRGLSISSQDKLCPLRGMPVSVPSSGDYQFLQYYKGYENWKCSFRPLIRGLSISSDRE